MPIKKHPGGSSYEDQKMNISQKCQLKGKSIWFSFLLWFQHWQNFQEKKRKEKRKKIEFPFLHLWNRYPIVDANKKFLWIYYLLWKLIGFMGSCTLLVKPTKMSFLRRKEPSYDLGLSWWASLLRGDPNVSGCLSCVVDSPVHLESSAWEGLFKGTINGNVIL